MGLRQYLYSLLGIKDKSKETHISGKNDITPGDQNVDINTFADCVESITSLLLGNKHGIQLFIYDADTIKLLNSFHDQIADEKYENFRQTHRTEIDNIKDIIKSLTRDLEIVKLINSQSIQSSCCPSASSINYNLILENCALLCNKCNKLQEYAGTEGIPRDPIKQNQNKYLQKPYEETSNISSGHIVKEPQIKSEEDTLNNPTASKYNRIGQQTSYEKMPNLSSERSRNVKELRLKPQEQAFRKATSTYTPNVKDLQLKAEEEKPNKPGDWVNNTLKKIEQIRNEIETLAIRVDRFSGTPEDKEYLELDHKLLKNVMKIDIIPTNDYEEIRLARREAIEYAYKYMNKLQEKVGEK